MYHSIKSHMGFWQTPSYHQATPMRRGRRFVQHIEHATKYQTGDEAYMVMLFNNIQGEVVPNNTPFVKHEPQKATQA